MLPNSVKKCPTFYSLGSLHAVFGTCAKRKGLFIHLKTCGFFIGRPVAIRAMNAPDNQPSLAMSLPTRIYSPMKSRSLNNKTSPRKHRSYSETSEDTLFDLEGFQSSKNCEPFYESDEDSSGTYVQLSF